jgi:hypothetical protein
MLPFLFPYMEQSAIFDQFPRDLVRFDRIAATSPAEDLRWFATLSTTLLGGGTQPWNLSQFKIPTLTCPSDAKQLTAVWTRGHIRASTTTGTGVTAHLFSGGPPGWPIEALGRTNYLGMCGRPDVEGGTWEGMFRNRSKTRFADVMDGLSNTLAMTECHGGVSGTTSGAWLWMSAITLPSSTAWLPGQNNWYNANSYHTGIINATLGDGSIRSVGTTIDANVWRAFCGMKDGVVTGEIP